jgi:hypothetical protein
MRMGTEQLRKKPYFKQRVTVARNVQTKRLSGILLICPLHRRFTLLTRMRIKNLLFLTILSIVFCSLGLSAVLAQSPAVLLAVNDSGDSIDANSGDGICADATGHCTLRAAIEESNTTHGNVIIFDLPKPTVINLTLGELNILSSMDIVGPGARFLTIQRSSAIGTPDFRIFHVQVGTRQNFGIRGATVRNGKDESGGAIYVAADASTQVFDVALTDNRATSGGALAVFGTAWVVRSLINSNTATGLGGGIFNTVASTVYVNASTLTGNSAQTAGAIDNHGLLTLVNATVSRNSATESCSGVFSRSDGTVTVLNTIIGGDASGTVMSIQGTFQSAGNNLITDARGSTGFANGVNGDQISDNDQIDPMLAALANNGGQTDTMALTAGSPAIDHGNNCVVTTCSSLPRLAIRTPNDQRNYRRSIFGSLVDIGAYEAGGSNLNGSFSFGLFMGSIPPGLPRYFGSIAALTNATTLEKRYSFVTPFGRVRFQDLPSGPVYVLEIRSKHSNLSHIEVLAF